TTPDDRFQTFLDTSKLPAGPTTLSATTTGPGRTFTHTIQVTIVPHALSSAPVWPSVALFATRGGSTIVMPSRSTSGSATLTVQGTISGPPGTELLIRGSGFNPASAQGNVARFTSKVDGKVYELPGIVIADGGSSPMQTFKTVIPPLTAGEATLTVRNDSTSA